MLHTSMMLTVPLQLSDIGFLLIYVAGEGSFSLKTVCVRVQRLYMAMMKTISGKTTVYMPLLCREKMLGFLYVQRTIKKGLSAMNVRVPGAPIYLLCKVNACNVHKNMCMKE